MELTSLENDVKVARQVITDITKVGTEIYDGLAKENGLKEARQRAIAKQTDKGDVERAIEVCVHISFHLCVVHCFRTQAQQTA